MKRLMVQKASAHGQFLPGPAPAVRLPAKCHLTALSAASDTENSALPLSSTAGGVEELSVIPDMLTALPQILKSASP